MFRFFTLIALLGIAVEVCGQEIPSSTQLKRDRDLLLKINNESTDQGSKNANILASEGLGNPQVVNGMINAIALEADVATSTSQLIFMIKVFERMRGAADEKDESGWDAVQERFQAQADSLRDTMAFQRKLGNFHQGTRPYLSAALERKIAIIKIAQRYARKP